MAEDQVRQAITEFSTFPVQFEAIGEGPGDGGRPAAAEGRTVDATIRDLLGWRVREDDPKGFVAALSRAFSFVEVEGHREWRYHPQSLTVQADLGGVTGAQASIYTRTKTTIEQVLPIIDRMRPLDSAADDERVEASRAIVRGRLEQLPVELGLDGGPRVARVDEIFRVLLEFDPAKPVPAEIPVAGEIGRLGERFGFDRTNVNTVDEEEALTDFQVLADYVISLAAGWARVRRTFIRGQNQERYLGTQLVHLSRALAIVAETAEEARRALRSVYIGDAEMELIDVQSGVQPPLSLAEGLRWTEEVATVEGPKLVTEAGKEGVVALAPTLSHLSRFASGAARQRNVGGRSPRVRRAFNDLSTNLRRASRSMLGISPERPTITDVAPQVSRDGNFVVLLNVIGTNFRLPADVFLTAGRSSFGADSVDVQDDETRLIASFDPPVPVPSDRQFTVVVEIDGEADEFQFRVPDSPAIS